MFSLPLVVWIMRGYFEDLPVELEESASIDGASRSPHIHAYHIAAGAPRHNGGQHPVSATGVERFPVCRGADEQCHANVAGKDGGFTAGDSGMDWGGLTASGMLVILPVIIFSFAAQRHLVAGLSSGAVKG